MKEEKEGVLHIIFIFIGIALLSLGTFYFFTDDKINLEDNKKEEVKEDINKDIIKQISLIDNVETELTLKNGNNVKIKYYKDEESSNNIFTYNNKISYETSSELEMCDQFYLYNNSIVSYCYYGSATSGHLYITDSNGTSKKIDEFGTGEFKMIPEGIRLRDSKLIVDGLRVKEGAILKNEEKEVDLCNKEEIQNNNIDLNLEAFANYELIINNNDISFELIKSNKTINEFINESCKIVE